MSNYQIHPMQLEEAKRINVTIQPSSNKRKKLDLYDKHGNFMMSIGAKNHEDIFSLQEKNMAWIDIYQQRERFMKRHARDCSDKFVYESRLFWCF